MNFRERFDEKGFLKGLTRADVGNVGHPKPGNRMLNDIIFIETLQKGI